MEDSLDAILGQYARNGFRGRFAVRAGGRVHCFACGADPAAAQVPMEAVHRLEGMSDPSEEALAAALTCPACGAKGTLVLPYGPGAGAEDAAVLAALMDDRDRSLLPPGL